jgi:hypothetical protein
MIAVNNISIYRARCDEFDDTRLNQSSHGCTIEIMSFPVVLCILPEMMEFARGEKGKHFQAGVLFTATTHSNLIVCR